jgi:hypothetical protein
MKKMIQILMILFTIALAGCKTTIEIEIPDVDSISISVKDNIVNADGDDYTRINVIPYDINDYALDEDDYFIEYKISPSIGAKIDNYGIFTATKAGTYSVQVKIDGILSNSITITAVESNIVNSVVITASANAVYADGTDDSQISVKAYNSSGKEISLTGKTASFYTTAGSAVSTTGKFTATTAGSYSVWAKVDGVSSNTVTISVRRGLKIVNAATTSIHLITWEPTGNNRYWFTPSTEYSKFYPYDNNQVPTLKSGTSFQQEVISGTSYLYFVMTDKSDFGYYRTTTKVAVGSAYGAADGRTFEFTNVTTGVETDEKQNDLPAPVIREIKIFKGVRSVVREIPLIKITKEEMNK